MCISKSGNKVSNMAEKCTLKLGLTPLFALCLPLSYDALFTGIIQTTLLSLNQMRFILSVNSIFCYCISVLKYWAFCRGMINLWQFGQERTVLYQHFIKLSINCNSTFCSKMPVDSVCPICLHEIEKLRKQSGWCMFITFGCVGKSV